MDFVIKLLLLSSLLSSSAFALNLTAIEFPSLPFTFNFNSVAAAAAAGDDCYENNNRNQNPPNSVGKKPQNLKLHLNHRPLHHPNSTKQASLLAAAHKDLSRLQTLFHKKTNRIKSGDTADGIPKAHAELAGKLTATIQSGVSLGSGEYFINAFVGTPATRYSLILDTGSDLNWLQCLPCLDCFDQRGPVFDPSASSSYRHVSCSDPRCSLVSSPDPNRTCGAGDPCPYFYWYGDRSNTTGDLAVETFTVNLTSADGSSSRSHRVDDVIFGCGHWNRGLFHGAAGLLGLGRGPLSFASQLRALYGHTFSYCLVDRDSDLTVSSKLIFGEDDSLSGHPNLNYTSFAAGKENSSSVDTFYYVHVKEVRIGDEALSIPEETWNVNGDGTGGTIIDSGTTLSYFVDPAYDLIRQAFIRKVKYPLVADFPVLSPCYNVTGVDNVEMPGFSIVFGDGARWDFPVENYFIRLEPEGIMCLAILGTPRSSLSIIGNYQQQNFHVMYDTEKSRLGFAPMRCADV